MAFAMSLPKHKRIKYYNPDGTEVFEEEDRWAIVRAVHSAPEDEGDQDEEAQEPKSSAKPPAQPLEALEKLHMARGELSMALDLIEMLEAQQFLGIASVPPREPPPAAAARASRLRLQSTARQLQAAGEQLRSGAAALRAHLGVEDRFFGEVAQLAGDWLVLPTAEFSFSGGAAPYRAELLHAGSGEGGPGLPGGLELARAPDGRVQVASPAGERATGAAAAAAVLAGCQQEALWGSLQAALEREALASRASAAAQKLASEVLRVGRGGRSSEARELAALLMRAHLPALDPLASGEPPRLLPAANAWLRHRCFSRSLWHSLRAQAAELCGAAQEVSLAAVHVPGPARSGIRLQLPGCGASVLLLLRADSLEVRGAPPPPKQRWALGSTTFAVRPADIGGLLRRLAHSREPAE